MKNENNILDINDYISLTLAELHPELSRFPYPLFSVDTRDCPDLYASCVLLECDGVKILITAAHAIWEIKKAGSAVHLGAKIITELPSKFVSTSEQGNDPLDIAAIILPSDLIDKEKLEFLPLSRTTLGRQFTDFHLRCIHGYPCTKNKQNKRIDQVNKNFTRYCFTYAGASRQISVDYSKFEKDQNLHIALQYDKHGINEKGVKVNPPHPKGISGGGLWLVPDSTSPKNIFLEGISIEYHKSSSLVFATRIEHAIYFLRQHVIVNA